MITDEEIGNLLREKGVPVTPQNIMIWRRLYSSMWLITLPVRPFIRIADFIHYFVSPSVRANRRVLKKCQELLSKYGDSPQHKE